MQPSSSKPDQVLLDENLVQSKHILCFTSSDSPADPSIDAYKAPFYIREHAKRILRGALWNDSQFLEELNVMDYSLLVAVDDTTNEIVVGIVGECRQTAPQVDHPDKSL